MYPTLPSRMSARVMPPSARGDTRGGAAVGAPGALMLVPGDCAQVLRQPLSECPELVEGGILARAKRRFDRARSLVADVGEYVPFPEHPRCRLDDCASVCLV